MLFQQHGIIPWLLAPGATFQAASINTSSSSGASSLLMLRRIGIMSRLVDIALAVHTSELLAENYNYLKHQLLCTVLAAFQIDIHRRAQLAQAPKIAPASAGQANELQKLAAGSGARRVKQTVAPPPRPVLPAPAASPSDVSANPFAFPSILGLQRGVALPPFPGIHTMPTSGSSWPLPHKATATLANSQMTDVGTVYLYIVSNIFMVSSIDRHPNYAALYPVIVIIAVLAE
jgi:hypothetical protein